MNNQEAYKLTQDAKHGIISLEEWSQSLTGEVIYGKENLRRCSIFVEKMLSYSTYDYDIEKAKSKQLGYQTYREINKIAREQLFLDKIVNAIDHLPKLTWNPIEESDGDDETGVLCLADAHCGLVLNFKDTSNKTINKYSPQILQERFNLLGNKLKKDKELYFKYKKLVIFDLGDNIHGILRLEDLTHIEGGVIDNIIYYSELISQFLNKLSNDLHVNIEYYLIGGNHNQLRLLESHNNFNNEDVGKIIHEFVSLRVQENPYIKIHPFNDMAFTCINGYNILALHGNNSKSNLYEEMKFWENYNNTPINILLLGHIHHKEEVNIGMNQEVIKCPSLMGIEYYGKKIRRSSKAAAKFMVFKNHDTPIHKEYVLN